MLQIENLSCLRGQRQLFEGLSFTLDVGEICQITGPNGSGKTSLLRIVCGLADADLGAVSWQQQNIKANRELFCSDLLYIGHKVGVNTHLTAFENLQSWCDLQQLHIESQEIDKALIKVGLYGREDIPAMRLSAGQQRRIALARLVLSKAKLWILDEPFTAIDAKGVTVMQQWFAEHLNKGGMILFTSHQAIDNQLLTLKTVALDG